MSKTLKVLVIEDETSIRELLKDTIEALGHEALVMDCGLGAVKEVVRWHPDLVLIDILLPYTTGFDVLRGIRLLPVQPRIYLMSAHQEMDNTMVRFLKADGFISKAGTQGESFIEHIERVLREASES